MAYRTMLSLTTGFTPFKLVFGREMRTGVDFSTPFAEESLVSKDHLLSIIAELEELHECAREVINAKFERAAHRLSVKAVRKNFHPGVIVGIPNHTMALTAPSKFAPRWSIPNRVLEVHRVNLKVKSSKTGTVSVVNHDYLKHSARANQKTEVSTKEAGSQIEVAEVQRTIPKANGTDGTKAKHRKPARGASPGRCEIADRSFQNNNSTNYFSRVRRTRSGKESKRSSIQRTFIASTLTAP